MSDLAGLLGNSGSTGFARDARFLPGVAALQPREAAAAVPDALADAFAEGFASGLSEAEAAAQLRQAEAATARERLGFSFSRLDAELAEALRIKLQETVITLCEASLQPLAIDPALLARRVERAVAMFARADDERVIRLNPDDLDLVAHELPAEWTFVADAGLARGNLRVETQHGGAEDGPEQWRLALAEALRLC